MKRIKSEVILFVYILEAVIISYAIVYHNGHKVDVPVKPVTIIKTEPKTVNKVVMVSKIVDFNKDLTNVPKPTYAKPESYKIAKTPSGYAIMLPGGTLCDGRYITPEETQMQIYNMAKMSEDSWIKSGGTSW